MDDLKKIIRNVPDFPKPGILFYDITTLLQDPDGLRSAVDHMIEPFASGDVDVIVGIESRGFIFGSMIADRLHAGFVPVRKPGKLPSKTTAASYSLEYGKDSLELHEDACKHGKNVLIVDDLLATGGTARAAAELVERVGGKVQGITFLIELTDLHGREQLTGHKLHSVLKY